MRRISELTKDEREHALELYGESNVIDCHLDSVLADDYVGRMLGSGVTAVNLDGGSLENIAEKHGVVEGHPDVFVGPVTAVGEIRDAKEEGKIAVFLGAESAEELLDSREVELNLEKLPLLHRLGLRIVQPRFNDGNVFADGCAEAGVFEVLAVLIYHFFTKEPHGS